MKRYACIASLLTLAAINLLLIFLVCAMFRLPSGGGFYWQLYFRAMISLTTSIPLSALLLIACYGALSESRLYARMLVIGVCAVLVLATFFLGGTMIPGIAISDIPGGFKSLLGPSVCLFVALLPFRQMLGWRIVWFSNSFPPSSQGKFRILHLWAWMAAIAIPLGVTQSIYGSRTGIILLMALKELVSLLFVLIPCLWLAGTTKNRRWWVPAVFGLAIVVAFCTSAIKLTIYTAMKGPPLAWWDYVLVLEEPLLYNLAAAGIFLGNLLCLESLGMRLVRPPRITHVAFPAVSNCASAARRLSSADWLGKVTVRRWRP